jgi:hypothetical protein
MALKQRSSQNACHLVDPEFAEMAFSEARWLIGPIAPPIHEIRRLQD